MSTRMAYALTSALALSSRSVLSEAGLDPGDPANVAARDCRRHCDAGVRVVEVRLDHDVSNAVTTGFTTGIPL